MEENQTNENKNRTEASEKRIARPARRNYEKDSKGEKDEKRENHDSNKRRFKPRQPKDANGTEKPRNAQKPQNHKTHNPRFAKQENGQDNQSGKMREKPRGNGGRFDKNYGNKEVNVSNLELRKAVELNAKVHENALTLHSQVKVNPNGKVRITPLGGLGEIGGNMTIIETQNSAIIIDAGMSFPTIVCMA